MHVLGHGAVMVGMGERTTPMAGELLTSALLRAGQATQVIAVELPATGAMMHLDTVLTMHDLPDRARRILSGHGPARSPGGGSNGRCWCSERK